MRNYTTRLWVLALLSALLLSALPALGWNSDAPVVSPLGGLPWILLMWWICSRNQDKPIGGWLLYFYIQLYASAVFGLVFIIPTLKDYDPAIWQNKSLYALYVISLFPAQSLLILQIVVATVLLMQRNWKWVQLLMLTMAMSTAFAVLAIVIDTRYFPTSLMYRIFQISYAVIWLMYFQTSTRVKAVFQDDNWRGVAARPTPSIVPTAGLFYFYCPKCGSKVPDRAAFCGECGAEAPPPSAALTIVGPLPADGGSPSSAEAATPPALEDAQQAKRENTVRNAVYAAGLLYSAAAVAALLLHLEVRAEIRIVKAVQEIQVKLADLVVNRKERSPRMLELLRWPNGASDSSAQGFLQRTAELAPLLNDEVTRGKDVEGDALKVLGGIPQGNINCARATLVARAAQEDIELYRSFQQEVSLADRAQLRSGAERERFVNSELAAIRTQEGEALQRRNGTLEQLK